MTVHTDIPELEQMRNYSEENRPDWSIVRQLTPDVGKSQNSVGPYVEHLVTKLDPDMIARVRNHGFPYKSLSTSGVPVNRKPRVYKPKQLFPSKGLKKSQNLIDWDEYMTTGTSSLQQPNYDGESKSIMEKVIIRTMIYSNCIILFVGHSDDQFFFNDVLVDVTYFHPSSG